MKKNTVKVFVLGLMLAGSFAAKAQTAEQKRTITQNYDKEALAQIAEEFAITAKKNKEDAIAAAAIKGWPLTYITKEGNHAELMSLLSNGEPLYYQTLNANAAFTSGITALRTGGGLGINITGANMYLAIWDEDRPREQHNTFGGRLIPSDASTGQSLHSTHVMGTMMGSGINSDDLSGRGMAYEAAGGSYDWDNDTSEMATAASSALLVSNHSYGNKAANVETQPWMYGAYNYQAHDYDVVAFAAKYYLIIQAAGNDRGQGYNSEKNGYDLINGSKTAKNAITVAAVRGLDEAYATPSQVIMSSFSSWGPTDDNRIKPDISAKGVDVYSSIISGNSNNTYGSLDGTSMASPVVTGGALLLQQLYAQENEGAFMRSATLRGLICHTADEAGPSDGPDPMFGWGLFDAKKGAEAILNNTSAIIEEKSLSTNASYTFAVNAIGNVPLQVSIAWTDPAGSTNNGTTDSAAIKPVNDLDVRVTQGNNTYFPWKLAELHDSPAIQGDNTVDNIERIDIPSPVGQYTVTVTHKSTLSQGPQQYSVIVTGASKVLGLADNDINLFSVWPNPANSVLNVNLNETLTDDASVVFYDIQGREVLKNSLMAAQSAINIDKLSAGVYMVKVTQAGKQQVKKVVINK
jgi:hypothetical protein